MHHPGVATHKHQRPIKKQEPVCWLVRFENRIKMTHVKKAMR